MKIKELIYLFGIQPKPKTYPWEVMEYDLPEDGLVQYAQWQHPAETIKPVRHREVTELRKFLSPGDVAIDIGAHSGDTTIPMALAVGPSGCVLALEPNPYVFGVLEKNSNLNLDKTNIVPLMFAATPQPGTFYFEYSDEGFCNGGLHDNISKWRHGHAFKLKVQGKHLPSYLNKYHADLIPKIRLIKVDAEGFDYQILKSLETLISLVKPYIKAEIFKHVPLDIREEMYDFLLGHGYEVYRVQDELDFLGEPLTQENLMEERHYDVFCVPASTRS